MAGHNKWSKVKRIKGAIDAKRGKLFSKLAKEIAVAAKLGGPDPDANVRLRSAITSARTQNMPNDNIERAIKRGSGETGEAALEEVTYEGYATAGVAVLVEAATDNRNRTAAPDRLAAVAEALRLASVAVGSQKLIYVPRTTVSVNDETTVAQVLRLHDALDDNDDVLNVYSNFDLPPELLERLSGQN
jgi:transcriptional/translational regulatory protein YebC/TACO1